MDCIPFAFNERRSFHWKLLHKTIRLLLPLPEQQHMFSRLCQIPELSKTLEKNQIFSLDGVATPSHPRLPFSSLLSFPFLLSLSLSIQISFKKEDPAKIPIFFIFSDIQKIVAKWNRKGSLL